MTNSTETPTIEIRDFSQTAPTCRAGRPAAISATLANIGEGTIELAAGLALPQGVMLIAADAPDAIRLGAGETIKLEWAVQAATETTCEIGLHVAAGQTSASASLRMYFLPEVEFQKLEYIPEPKKVKARYLVGAHHCPIWEAATPQLWDNTIRHPERTPALGYYDGGHPEVADWETKWASEHGIDFFVYCWYRTTQGGPVTTQFSDAIHKGFFKSRYQQHMKFTIMWENQQKGTSGIDDMADLRDNLLPFWIENYFTHPSYLVIDDKPVLFIYKPDMVVADLGSVEAAAAAIETMREGCRAAGFKGLWVLGEMRYLDAEGIALMKTIGLDSTFSYCWFVHNDPTPEQASDAQIKQMESIQQLGILPQIATASQAWSGWNDEGSMWKIPPPEFGTLLHRVEGFMATLPKDELGSQMVLLDNWNEWSEGHYIAPYREYGFLYLDAVRRALSDATEPHVDLLPEDIGMGPYDKSMRKQ